MPVADPSFRRGFSVAEVVDWINRLAGGGRVVGARGAEGLGSAWVERMADLGGSRPGDLAFFFSRDFEAEILAARPTLLVTAEPFVEPMTAARLPVVQESIVFSARDPYLAMAVASARFAELLKQDLEAATLAMGEEPEIGSGARVLPGAHVCRGARIGARTVIHPGCYVGAGAVIGADCEIFPGVTIYERVRIGDRVRIHAGARIGADGFGYAPRMEAGKVVAHEKIHHLGSVSIGEDVEIGANTCVDRGTIGDTMIERMAKVDNLVQVGHNARIAEGAILCGGVAMAGGASVGAFAYIGGMTGITNRIHVGAGARIAAQSLISKDVPPGESACGNPQREYHLHFRAHAALNRLVSKKGRARHAGKESDRS